MKSLDLRKLTHALVLADTNSYARASEKLHLTQSALTRSIQALETELGLTLFDRGKSGVQATRDGEIVLARARHLLRDAHSLEREISLIRQAESGEIAFGVGPAMPSLFLPGLMSRLCRDHPGLDVEVYIESGYRLLTMLLEDTLEFFVADVNHLDGLNSAQVCTEALVEFPAHFYVRTGHPLLAQALLSDEMLARYPLVSAQYHQREIKSSGHGTLPGRRSSSQMLCNDLSTLRRMVLHSDAVLIGIPPMINDELAAGRIQPLPLDKHQGDPLCRVGLVSLAGRTPSRIAGVIRGLIHEQLAAE
ncbi:MAG: LysR family transcriptional regulator [Porticoccaceae bacterium]